MGTPRQLVVTEQSPSLWRVAFNNPPLNLIGPVMVMELQTLLSEIEKDNLVAVVVFETANPHYFLAHWDIAADPAQVDNLPKAPTGFHPGWTFSSGSASCQWSR
jgi:enoyl-CoA hydratase/carnithine racemase